MYAERVILETDALGQVKAWPTLPVNRRLEAIFLVLETEAVPGMEAGDPIAQEAPALHAAPVRRRPSPGLAGRVELLGDDLTGSVPSAQWDLPS